MNQNYEKILEVIEKAGLIALELQSDLEIRKKSDGVDVSTQVDLKIEEMLRNAIAKLFPDDDFWGEEMENTSTNSEYTWYVDPIDGTKFFVADIPLWSISIARVRKGEKVPEFAAIYVPKEGTAIYALKGKGAWMDHEKLENKKTPDISKVTIAFDFSPSKTSKLNTFVYNKFPKLLENFYRVRFLGCGSLSISWTASGFFGCYIKYLSTIKEYNDVAAGLLIAQESGLNVDYQTLSNGLDRIIICKKNLLTQVLEVIN